MAVETPPPEGGRPVIVLAVCLLVIAFCVVGCFLLPAYIDEPDDQPQ